MKTLTQLSKEELEAAELGELVRDLTAVANRGVKSYTRRRIGEYLLAHDRRLVEAAFAATEVEKEENDEEWSDFFQGEAAGFNKALSEVNNLKQEFLK